LSVVAALYQTCVNIEIKNVLVSQRIAEKYPTEVVTVEFAALIASPFDANSGAKQFEKREVRFDAKIPLKRCLLCFQVDQPIV
jgi:hypothetical protein